MHTADEAYRPDIDGLRAVAVLAVVAFHAFPQWLPGGYIGVDVFFVISGFLISSQLMAAAANGTLSFGDFYARRIRRIFPALILVLTATSIGGWWLLLPHEWETLGRHVGASAIFANNIVLWSEAGYFDGPSELKPLLHLWSLGVEEQFYLIWPLLVWWWWKRDVRWSAAITIVVIASFATNVTVVAQGAAQAAFFLPHTRLWQLGAGALLAALARERPVRASIARWLHRSPSTDAETRTGNLLSIAGVSLIVLSSVALTRGVAHPDWWSHGAIAAVSTVVRWIAALLWLNGEAAAYPGWSALAPTVGATLVIAAGPGAIWNRTWLSARPVVFVGLISYPLYLWHWALLSFLQITEQGDVSRPLKAAAIAVSFVLASITYLVVERPIRRAVSPATLRRVVPIVAPMVLIGLVMAAAMATGWLTPPARTALQIDTVVPAALNESLCRTRWPGLGEYCQQFDPDLPVTTALLGDSHAAHFLPGLGALLKVKGETLVHLGQTGCPPLVGIERLYQTGDNSCTRVNRAVIDAVLADTSIVTVWLSFRSALATTGAEIGGRAADLFRTTSGTATNGVAIGEALRATVAALQSGGRKVGIILQVPELGFRVDQCTGRPFSLAHGPARVPCSIARADVMARQAAYRELIAQVRDASGIAVYDPVPALCDPTACQAIAEGRVLYSDDNHLGVFGSSWALRGF